jgi:hypothetical protein
MGAVLGLSLLCASGCKDEGQAHYAKARAQYQTLLEQMKRPTDPAFDPVVAELKQVEKGSSAYQKAQTMLGAIERARAEPRPPMPLAVHPSAPAGEPADVAAQREACILLSQKLGETREPQARAKVEAALKDCQMKLEKVVESHHSDNP